MQEIKYNEAGYIIAGKRLYTNVHHLPEEVVRAILKDRYTTEGEAPSDFSASSLVAPAQLVALERAFPDKMRIFDVTDDYWSFLGSIAHQVLEEAWHASMNSIVERRLYMPVHGKMLSGKMDCYAEPQIRDYKTTKVYKIQKGDYSDWEKAQNVYAQLCRSNNMPVESINIIVLLTNWSKGERYKKNYPQAPILTIPLRLWSEKEALAYINHRAEQLMCATDLLRLREEQECTLDEITSEISERFPCSSKEMWEDVKDYAVMKKGASENDRATKSCETEAEAEEYIGMKGWHATYQVVKRMTARTRCIDWCPAASICAQYKAYSGGIDVTESESKGCVLQ